VALRGSAVARSLLCSALLWRVWREQRWKVVVGPVTLSGLLLVLSAVTFFWPGLLTGPSKYALENTAREYFAALPNRTGIVAALLFLQGPWLLAIFSAMNGASVAYNTVASESARGGIELLLAGPLSPSEIFGGMLKSSLIRALFAWACMAIALLAPATAVLAILRVEVSLPTSYYAASFLLPIPMVLFANVIALFLALRFPRLAQLRAGASGNVLQILAAAPTTAFCVVISIQPGRDLLKLSLIACLVGILGAVGAGFLVRRRFRPELFLES